jgi:hypothetical protein
MIQILQMQSLLAIFWVGEINMKLNFKYSILLLLPFLVVGLLFTNAGTVDQIQVSILQNIQRINGHLANPSFSQTAKETLRGHKIYLVNRLAKRLGLASCNGLKQAIPALESGVYMTYDVAGANTYKTRYCDVSTMQDFELQSSASNLLRIDSNIAPYFDTFSLRANSTATPVRYEIPGVVQVIRVTPLSAQTPCPTTSYGFDAAGVWAKNNCQAQFMVLTAQGTRYLDALDPQSVQPFKSGITSIRLNANKLLVQGWACQVANNTPTEVQLYFGDASLAGVFMATQVTSVAHSPAVVSQCQTSAQATHGFNFSVDLVENSTLTQVQKEALRLWSRTPENKYIFLYAVAHKENGFSMHTVSSSGEVLIPKVSDFNQITGALDNASVIGSDLLVRGWACHIGDPRSIGIHIYQKYPAGQGGVYIGGGAGNISHEAAVSNRCLGGGMAHRYAIKIPLASKVLPSNAPLYVYGISLISGIANTLLGNSGNVKIPVYTGSPPLCTPSTVICSNDQRLLIGKDKLGCEVRQCMQVRSGSDR